MCLDQAEHGTGIAGMIGTGIIGAGSGANRAQARRALLPFPIAVAAFGHPPVPANPAGLMASRRRPGTAPALDGRRKRDAPSRAAIGGAA